jgi:organic radical activating enzyme
MLRVSRLPSGEPEIFYSLQGEGVTAGMPTVFLRLATCNLTCTWCDTKYTWDWSNYDYAREVVSASIADVEQSVVGYGCRHLVVTGGEPLLQQTALAPLMLSLKRKGFYCEVETNGTLAPSQDMMEAVSQWNVSPKLGNSGVDRSRREVPRAIAAFRDLDNAYFKFVIAEADDVEEASSLVDRHDIPAGRVILMPEGVTAKSIEKRSKWVAKACTERGFRFSTRLHILLWGDERGR